MLEQNNHLATGVVKPHVVLMGQTPPPWHGQAVATQILFDHDWPDFEVTRIRMDYSEEMYEVGRFNLKKIGRLFRLLRSTRKSLERSSESILFYPPASAKWIPFLRDVVFLACVRKKAAKTVFIYHASGLAEFTEGNSIRKWLADFAYHGADMALEVAEEKIAPHHTYEAKQYAWCPCGIEVPELPRPTKDRSARMKVLFVGSLQEGKGILEILKTAAAIRDRGHGGDFIFQIVGRWMDADFEKEVLSLHKKLELDSIVEFPGQLTGDEKWKAYQASDIFFFPSHYPSEASPIVLMEALGAGLPVISTQWNGIPALMKGCETATLLPIKSPEAYADALLSWHQKTEDLDATSETSLRFYRENFRPESFVKRVNDAFLSVAEQNAPLPVATSYQDGHFQPLRTSVYLADQNPGHDRSLGISRMSSVILEQMVTRSEIELDVVSSFTSQQGPQKGTRRSMLPWGTRSKVMRVFTDNLHPILSWFRQPADIWYFPKGFLPQFKLLNAPTVVTVHDTIIQHYWDHYPSWRNHSEYAYWAKLLKTTLLNADGIFTVSQNAKEQILAFMERYRIPEKEILITYEPCIYEHLEQPLAPKKNDSILHLASREPHKRTHHLMSWWAQRSLKDSNLPCLVLVGNLPPECTPLIEKYSCFQVHPYLSDDKLREVFMQSKALVLPSEVEGFGLPALEAYYLGTPVCFNRSTSVGEILEGPATIGAFDLDSADSLWLAIEKVSAMTPEEIQNIGLKLRERFAAKKVVDRMIRGFHKIVREKNIRS